MIRGIEKEGFKEMTEEASREEGRKEASEKERGRERTNSLGIIEMFRRKRELECEGITRLQRSKITPRSPVKMQEGGREGGVRGVDE